MMDAIERYSFRAIIWALYVFLLAPLACIVIVSFNNDAIQSFPPTRWSPRWYEFVLQNAGFVHAAAVSALLALGAVVVATPLGVMAAIGLWKSSWRGKPLLEAFFVMPIIVPGLVIGVALLVALAAVDIRQAPIRLLVGHALIVMPYVVRTTLASLLQIDPSLEEAAGTLGASSRRAFFSIILPLIRPGIIAGMVFGFILSFDDVNVSLFLVDARTATLPISIMSYLEYNSDPSVAAISSMQIAIIFALTMVLERWFGLQRLFAGH